jgi:hypothetical protein
VYQTRSSLVGVSTYTARAIDPVAGLVIILQTADVTFVCVSGSWVPATDPQELLFLYLNPTPPVTNRRMVSLRLDRVPPMLGGSNALNSIAFGSTSNVIWSGAASITPIVIGSEEWSGGSRSIVTGTFKALVLTFDFPVAGTGTYTVVTRWDDGAGGSECDSAPVITTP